MATNWTHANSTVVGIVSSDFREAVSVCMGLVGLLSLLGSSSMIFLILYNKLFVLFRNRLILYLSISDMCQTFASVTSFAWVKVLPSIGPSCNFQGVMFIYGNCSSAFSSAMIATFVLLSMNSFHLQTKFGTPGLKFEIVSIILIFVVPGVFFFIGFMRGIETDKPFFTPVGFQSWCWISSAFPVERMMLQYTWLILIAFYLFIIYTYLGITFFQSRKFAPTDALSKKRQKLLVKMVGYPIIFFMVFVLLGIERLCEVISTAPGITPLVFPNPYIAVAVVLQTSLGFWNALYYGYTRKLYKMKSNTSTTSPNEKKGSKTHSK